MLEYPSPLTHYPLEWVDELAAIKDKESCIRLEKKDIAGLVHSDGLKRFYARLEELSQVEVPPPTAPIPEGPFTFLYVIPKKEHEIRKLAPFINQAFQQTKSQKIVDIGGGIGLLAQSLANQYDLPVTSLDMDPVLQKTGRERHLKNSRLPKNKVDYQNVKVELENAAFRNLLTSETMTIGLHTCGMLAVDHLKVSVKSHTKAMLNMGCCYHKLPDGGSGQNISKFAQELPNKLTLEQFALTLASRAHRKMDEGDFDFKYKVKQFRYALHFLLHDRYGHQAMVNLGNSHPSLYDEPFAVYAMEQFTRMNMLPNESMDELNTYFADPKLQDLIWRMQAATLIRNSFGRLLELYLQLDRVIYLEEQGYNSRLIEFFNEEISPRNLGIYAEAL